MPGRREVGQAWACGQVRPRWRVEVMAPDGGHFTGCANCKPVMARVIVATHTLSIQRRVTASMRRKDGRTMHVRKSTVAEPALASIYKALGITAAAGGTRKLIS